MKQLLPTPLLPRVIKPLSQHPPILLIYRVLRMHNIIEIVVVYIILVLAASLSSLIIHPVTQDLTLGPFDTILPTYIVHNQVNM